MPKIQRVEQPEHENQIAEDIKLLVNRQNEFMIWRNAIVPAGFYGRFNPRTGEYGPPQFLRAGEPGSPDYIGFQCMSTEFEGRSLKVGRFFGLEIKKPGEKPEPHQATWAERARRYGAFSGWADSVEVAWAALERARKGEDR